MGRRLVLFGFGALISIFFLTILDEENRFKKTFDAYLDYPDSDKRIIRQFQLSDTILYLTSDSLEINFFLQKAWVNYDMTKTDVYPKIYVLDNDVSSKNQRLHCRYYDMEKIKEGDQLKIYSKTEFVRLQEDILISSKSYTSYYSTVIIVLLIMIPVLYLIKKRLIKES